LRFALKSEGFSQVVIQELFDEAETEDAGL
jgi:hypothetical protein